MNMEQYLIASICILLALFVITFIVKLIKKKNNGENVDILDYLSSFSDKISVIAEQVILVCNMDSHEFTSEEEFKKELIEKVITTIKESATELGISINILNLIDEDILSDYIYKIIESNKDKLISMVSISNSNTSVEGLTTNTSEGSATIYSSQSTETDTSETTNK